MDQMVSQSVMLLRDCDAGPCYRCLFPKPSPPDMCASCSYTGVLGPVPGTIGVLQALEAIKILAKVPPYPSEYFECVVGWQRIESEIAVCGFPDNGIQKYETERQE